VIVVAVDQLLQSPRQNRNGHAGPYQVLETAKERQAAAKKAKK